MLLQSFHPKRIYRARGAMCDSQIGPLPHPSCKTFGQYGWELTREIECLLGWMIFLQSEKLFEDDQLN
jgi:hypothetical protein